MKILITGGSSLLGKYLLKTAPKEHEIETTWHTNYINGVTNYRMSLLDIGEMEYVINKSSPDVVIHCAGNGDVNYAEQHYQAAANTNARGTHRLTEILLKRDAKLVFISSNAVYDGDNPPYGSFSIRRPINNYGKIKKLAEDYVMQRKANFLIIRPYLLFGWPWGRQNWASNIINSLNQGKELKLVNDVIWQPTYAEDCALAIWKLLFQNYKSYNISSGESMTLYEFGLLIARVYGFDKKNIIPVQSDHFVNIAPRPRDTSYDLSDLDKMGIEMQGVENGIRRMKKEME